jgi:MFS family permease
VRGRSPDSCARIALTAAFVANGIFFGTLAARVPAIKDRLGLSDGALGVALLFVAVGALCAFPLVGRLIATLGSRPVTRVALVFDAAGIGLMALAPSLATLIVAAFLLGAANAGLDVAMNAHGVALEGRYGRPILSSLHAGWSIGGLVGAALGGLLAAAGLDVRFHLVVVPLAACAVALVLTRRLLPAGEDTAPPLPALRMPSRRVAMLGLIAFCSLFAEGVAADWSAVYLKDSLGAGAGLAAVAFAAYALTMAAGRLVGDRLTVRWGPSGLLVRCGLVAGAGLATALVIGHPAAGIVGFALLGAGVAPVVPVVFRAGGTTPGVPSGQGIAMVGWLGYFGLMAGPPVVGFAAEVIGLPAALGIVCGMVLAVALLAGSARPAPAPSPSARGAVAAC